MYRGLRLPISAQGGGSDGRRRLCLLPGTRLKGALPAREVDTVARPLYVQLFREPQRINDLLLRPQGLRPSLRQDPTQLPLSYRERDPSVGFRHLPRTQEQVGAGHLGQVRGLLQPDGGVLQCSGHHVDAGPVPPLLSRARQRAQEGGRHHLPHQLPSPRATAPPPPLRGITLHGALHLGFALIRVPWVRGSRAVGGKASLLDSARGVFICGSVLVPRLTGARSVPSGLAGKRACWTVVPRLTVGGIVRGRSPWLQA